MTSGFTCDKCRKSFEEPYSPWSSVYFAFAIHGEKQDRTYCHACGSRFRDVVNKFEHG